MSEFSYVLIMRLTVIHLVIFTIAAYIVIRVGKRKDGGNKHTDLFLLLLPMLFYSPILQTDDGEAILLFACISTHTAISVNLDQSSSEFTKSISRIFLIAIPIITTVGRCYAISPEMISTTHPLGTLIAQIAISFGVFILIGLKIRKQYQIDIC